MIIRILAEREPYASYPERYAEIGETENRKKFLLKGPSGPFFIVGGPEPLDGPKSDVLVMPAEDYLGLPGMGIEGRMIIAYGNVAAMAAAFERGCVDYLREPWPLQELLARALRILTPRARVDGVDFSVSNDLLRAAGRVVRLSESERRIARLLILNVGHLVTRDSLSYAVRESPSSGDRSLDNHISSLRRKMDTLHPGSRQALMAIRGMGYRLTSVSCG